MADSEEYSESMQGIIIDTGSTSTNYTLKVLIEDPFHFQIDVKIDTEIWNQYVNYSFRGHWKGFCENHPENGYLNDFYYNRQDDKFYMLLDSEDLTWQEVRLESDIIRELRSAWHLESHINGIFHIGQPCRFTGYAIDKNNRFHKPSAIDKNFEKFDWKYNPFTFYVSPLDENTIDNLIEKIPISKEMTKKMVRYHQEQDKAKQQKEKDDKKKNKKEKRETRFKKINAHFEKYQHIYKYGVIGGILWLISTIIQLIIIYKMFNNT